MNLSSILIFTTPDSLPTLQTKLCALPGIEVHYQCHDSGRLIVIQESADDDAEMDGLRRIKALSQVLAAEMIYHYVDHDLAPDAQASAQHLDQGSALS